jgi:hypothetical protein
VVGIPSGDACAGQNLFPDFQSTKRLTTQVLL